MKNKSSFDTKIRKGSLTDSAIGSAIEVHKTLGPGLLESTYEECLCYELSRIGIEFKRQVKLPVKYKSINLNCRYRVDIIIGGLLIVEIKAVNSLLPIHEAQLLTYMKLSNINTGLLINFNESVLRDGIKRMVL